MIHLKLLVIDTMNVTYCLKHLQKMSKEKAITYIKRAKEQLSGDSLTVRFCQMVCDNLDKALKELKETTMLTSDEMYKMKHCIGLDNKNPRRGVYQAYRNGVSYYEPDPIWEGLTSKGFANKRILKESDFTHCVNGDYAYSVNKDGLRAMEDYLGFRIEM